MSDEHRWRRKCFVICLLALFIGLIGMVLPEQEDIAFEYIVNNTDLYNNGRITGTTYIANDSAIQLFLIFHVIGTGASLVVDTNLSINGTVVEDRDYRTTAGAGIHEHFSMTAHIPKGANYSVTNSSNLHTIEWREYPILSGRNGTLSIIQNITQTGGGGGVSFDGSPVNLNGSALFNGSIINLSANINMLGFGLINSSTNLTTPGGTYYIGKNGTDTLSCGGATTPCLTIGYFVSKLYAKPVLLGNVTIHVYSGIYTENIDIGGIYPGNYRLTFEGEYKIIDSLIVNTSSAGSISTQANFTNTTAMTLNKYKNKIMYVWNGSNAGQYRIVDNNSADNLTYVGLLTNALTSGTRVDILEWNTTIKPINPVSIKLTSMSNVYINDMALDGGISAKFSSYFINRANLTTYFTPTNPFLTTYSGQVSSVYEVDTSIIQHDGTPNYVLWYTQFSSTLFKKSKIDQGTDFIGTIVQQGYFLSQEGSVFNGSTNGIYIDNNGNFQADNANGANPQNSFVKYNSLGINVVDGTCTNCISTDVFFSISYFRNTLDFQTKYAGTGTDFACFNVNGTLIRQNAAC